MLQQNRDWQLDIVKRVFGCGIEPDAFQAAYSRLSEEDQVRLKLVAKRVWLTLKLRYELSAAYTNPVASPDEMYALNHVELPSIEVYLLCTCLDTLAGKADHVKFTIWLRGNTKKASLRLDEIERVYSQYEDEQGVGRNLRCLFETLPQVTKNWLAKNVRLGSFKQQLSSKDADPETLIKRLYRYFYEIRRNAFTHGSVSRQTSMAEDIVAPVEHDGWWVVPAGGTFYFSYRRGIDEATILRVIIHSVGLKLLSIEPTQELIAANIKHHSRVNAAYAFLNEVEDNSVTLSYWTRLEEARMNDIRTSLIRNGIPPLESKATQLMIDRYSQDSSFESQLRKMTSHYLDQIKTLNSAILAFNKSNPCFETDSTGSWNVFKKFLDEKTTTPLYDSILNWPSKPELTNLWLLIRDPCYT